MHVGQPEGCPGKALMKVVVDLVENQMNFLVRDSGNYQYLQAAELVMETIGQEDSVHLSMTLDDLENLMNEINDYLKEPADDLENLKDTLDDYLGGSRGLNIGIPPTDY